MTLLVCAFLAAANSSAPSVTSPLASQAAPDPLIVRILTFGPGDHPFFKFGHDAIWIHDEEKHRDPVYNFGTFYFDSPWLIVDFLKGRFVYWLSVDSIRGTLYEYKADNRTVFSQELDLTPEQKRAMYEALQENSKPANAAYKYDYYRDNCASRVRDAIDRTIGGALHEASRGPAQMTFRGHTLRLTQEIWWEYAGLDMLLSNPIDKPIDQWAEMFLPGKVEEGLRRVKFSDGRPLVKSERLLITSTKPPEPTTTPGWHFWFFLVGALSASLLVVTAHYAPRAGLLRVANGLLLALFAGITGFLGTVFTLIWLFTNHDFSWHNENILQCAPFALALVVSGFAIALKKSAPRALFIARCGLAAALLGVVLKILPWFDQDNWREICLFVPLWIGIERSLAMRQDAQRGA